MRGSIWRASSLVTLAVMDAETSLNSHRINSSSRNIAEFNDSCFDRCLLVTMNRNWKRRSPCYALSPRVNSLISSLRLALAQLYSLLVIVQRYKLWTLV
jgi:hypothetical protein